MASVRDVRVELRRSGGETLAVGVRIEHDPAVRDQQRAGLEQVALRVGGHVGAGCESHAVAVGDHARAALPVRRRNRLV
jgi:hypothetical protein